MPYHSTTVAGQPPAVRAGVDCCITQLALLAVQPACLKSYPQVPLQHHQQPRPADDMAGGVGGQQQDLHGQQQALLLHLEATVCKTQSQSAHANISTADSTTLESTAGCPGFSTQHAANAAETAAGATVQCHAQHQASSSSAIATAALSPGVEMQLPAGDTFEAETVADAAAQRLPGTAQHMQATSSAAAVQLPTPLPLQDAQLELMVLSRQMQVLQHRQLQLLQLVVQQQDQQDYHCHQGEHSKRPCTTQHSSSQSSASSQSIISNGSSRSCSVLLNVATSVPSLPTNHALDCVHLVLLVRSRSASHQQQQQLLSDEQQPVGESAAVQPPGTLIADVPLLVLPAAAQQEVQQLLLPAMRQEVQAEQQQQQQQLGVLAPAAVDDIVSVTRLSLQMEHHAWQHYCQLANDIYVVMQLSTAAEAAISTCFSPAAGASQVVLLPNTSVSSQAAELEAAVPAASLELVAESLLFPLLLPFLAAQGMYNTLQLLLMCLPQRLQQQWHQEQLARMQELTSSAPAPVQLPAVSEEESCVTDVQKQLQDLQQEYHQGNLPPKQLQQQQMVTVSSSRDTGIVSDPSQHKQDCLQAAGAGSSKQGKPEQVTPPPAKLEAKDGVHDAWAAAAGSSCDSPAVAGRAPWHVPFTQFQAAHVEHRYLAWKQLSLLHLDCLSALFGLFYLAVLLRRMWSEPTTLFYFAVILTKVLPFLPLMMGQWQVYLRYRELLVSLVAPTMAVVACSLALRSKLSGSALIVLPDRAHSAYWKSRGELQTSIMRAFTHHMRLRPYVIATLMDACVSYWAFTSIGVPMLEAGARYGCAAVVSVGLSWAFEWYMRLRFLRAQPQQQRPWARDGGQAAS